MSEAAATPVPTRRIAPGPRGNLVTGNRAAYARDPIQMILDLQREYGDVARERVGPYLLHTVTHPDGVRQVLQGNYKNYVRGRFYENFKLFFGLGLLTTDGEYWLSHRRMAQPLFHRALVEGCTDTAKGAIGRMLDRWEEVSARGDQIELVAETMRVSLSILGRVVFNMDFSGYYDVVSPSVVVGLKTMIPQGNLNDFIPRWAPTPYNRRLARAQQTLRDAMQKVIAEHAVGGEGTIDLITLLQSGTDEETGRGLTDEEVHDEVMTVFMAGHETTGSGMAWTLYAIAQHPEVEERLEAEADAVLGGRAPTIEDLPQLTYARMVVDESLRLYPPIWAFTRDPVNDDEIGGYHIPAGSTIVLSPYATQRHHDFWDDPEAFDPERFAPERAKSVTPFSYFPFGSGSRKCIGFHLALLQMQLLTAMLAQRFRIRAVPGHEVTYGRRMVALRPRHGIRVTLEPRRD
jgi:cytochrome P450